MNKLHAVFQGKLGRMLARLEEYQASHNKLTAISRLKRLRFPLIVLCGYFVFASLVARVIIHSSSLQHVIHLIPENALCILTFACLTVGIPSSLLVDPAVLSFDPVWGIIKLSLTTVAVAILQISLLKATNLDSRLFAQHDRVPRKNITTYIVCLLFRTAPILPFGVATLYLFYKLRSVMAVALTTFIGSLIYYSLLSAIIYKV